MQRSWIFGGVTQTSSKKNAIACQNHVEAQGNKFTYLNINGRNPLTVDSIRDSDCELQRSPNTINIKLFMEDYHPPCRAMKNYNRSAGIGCVYSSMTTYSKYNGRNSRKLWLEN